MKKFPTRFLLAVIVAVAAIAAGTLSPAHAQWVWKDESNHTVVSDQPPPNNIPLKNIIKTPRGSSLTRKPIESDTDSAGSDAKKDSEPQTLAEKDMDYKKRQKEAAEASQKQADEANKAKAQQDRCKTLRSNLAGLESGIRIARTNEKGEREYLDDSQRQSEIQKSRTDMQGC